MASKTEASEAKDGKTLCFIVAPQKKIDTLACTAHLAMDTPSETVL